MVELEVEPLGLSVFEGVFEEEDEDDDDDDAGGVVFGEVVLVTKLVGSLDGGVEGGGVESVGVGVGVSVSVSLSVGVGVGVDVSPGVEVGGCTVGVSGAEDESGSVSVLLSGGVEDDEVTEGVELVTGPRPCLLTKS